MKSYDERNTFILKTTDRLKKLVRDKHSSLFCRTGSSVLKKFTISTPDSKKRKRRKKQRWKSWREKEKKRDFDR